RIKPEHSSIEAIEALEPITDLITQLEPYADQDSPSFLLLKQKLEMQELAKQFRALFKDQQELEVFFHALQERAQQLVNDTQNTIDQNNPNNSSDSSDSSDLSESSSSDE